MGKLVVGDREFDVDRLVSWDDSGWNATSDDAQPGKRYYWRPKLRSLPDPLRAPYDVVKRVIRKFVIHHDGLGDSKTCWNVLQNERSLSCHFLIDNDGTIYQTCNLSVMAYHAAAYNPDSIGVELCSRGDRKADPRFYEKRGVHDRPHQPCIVNGHTIDAWDFTAAQYESLHHLADRLRFILPELPLEFPRDPARPSRALLGTMDPDRDGHSTTAFGFAGYVGHYHLTTAKWDPGPFDFEKFVDRLRGQRVFPVWSGDRPAGQDKPVVPDDPDQLTRKTQELYDLNEKEAGGGFFPVGPWGETRLWHGGVHLAGKEGDPVFAPFPGRVVAARSGAAGPIGSTSFVLMRHDLDLGQRPLRFWSLYMHLGDPPDWLAKAATRRVLDAAVGVDGYDEPVLAGTVLGQVAVVGPGDLARPQLHFEIFAARSLFDGDPDWAKPVDDSGGTHFCEVPAIDDLIDKDHDQRLTHDELVGFYDGEVDDDLRRVPIGCISEWNDTPAWEEDLKTHGGRGLRGINVAAMVAEQLDPFTWWTEKVAAALGIPTDGYVYHYHPIRFVDRINRALRATAAGPAPDLAKAEATAVLGVTDDAHGDHMASAVDKGTPPDLHLGFDDLVQGFAGDR